MSTYSKRQTKKTLGIQNIKGVSVVNTQDGKKFTVKFRAEMERNGQRFLGGTATSTTEAATLANKLFTQVFGGKRLAQKAGYWNN